MVKPWLKYYDEGAVSSMRLSRSAPSRYTHIAVVGQALNHKELGLGVVNARTDEVESAPWIIKRVEQALDFYPPEAIFLNPDCGFGCFANRCV